MRSNANVEQVERLTYTIPEVARALGISERSVYNRIYDGTLTKMQIGRRVLVPAAALRALAGGA
ncbi:helix-turn-helix domain-containing protein [Sphingomonas aracearum]|uniref:DNA-binding protein n=1 Tax=Sphingomonas aracearum TaxID=2283317 RepID=A0A369VXC1_9SPHN|nr:helix-turn-helix domain-containing protein [Sphingomonas aracearum]RDE06237.1 DNA-binding protein [Sphingomonas aracearum]